MALPVLLLLMVGITWLGFSVIGQTEVLVEARNKTWKRRFENASDKPLQFPVLPTYDRKADFVSEKANKKVDVSPMFSRLPGPEAGHTVLAGSWDYRAMKFDKPPELELMVIAAAIGTAGNIASWKAQLDNPLGLLKDLGKRSESQATSDAGNASSGKPTSMSSNDSLPSQEGEVPPSQGKTPKEAEAETEAKRQEAKKQHVADFRATGFTYDPFRDEINATGDPAKKARDDQFELTQQANQKRMLARNTQDEEEKKKLFDEADALDRQAKLAEITYKRIQAQANHALDELRAMDFERYDLYAVLNQ
jgi:hypothetical protein